MEIDYILQQITAVPKEDPIAKTKYDFFKIGKNNEIKQK
jgi:hypothetical protein